VLDCELVSEVLTPWSRGWGRVWLGKLAVVCR